MKVNDLFEAGDLVSSWKPGDRVTIKWDNASAKFGTVKRIGRTMIHIILNGTDEVVAVPPKDVYPSYEAAFPEEPRKPFRRKTKSVDTATLDI